ncbi:MAG: hypothetical protein ACFFEN_07070 [Candidatus Thorarchaeota archaeon]
MDLRKRYEKIIFKVDEKVKIYRCKKCNYLYIDEEQEIPFEDVGVQWKCPKCRSPKKFFVEKEIPDKN